MVHLKMVKIVNSMLHTFYHNKNNNNKDITVPELKPNGHSKYHVIVQRIKRSLKPLGNGKLETSFPSSMHGSRSLDFRKKSYQKWSTGWSRCLTCFEIYSPARLAEIGLFEDVDAGVGLTL